MFLCDFINNYNYILSKIIEITVFFFFFRQVADAFSNNDTEQAKEVLMKMKYYTSIENRLKALKQDLGIVD